MYRVRIDRIRRLADNSIAFEYTESRDAQIGKERSKRGMVIPAMDRADVARAVESSVTQEQAVLFALADWLASSDPISSLAGKVVTVDASSPTKVVVS